MIVVFIKLICLTPLLSIFLHYFKQYTSFYQNSIVIYLGKIEFHQVKTAETYLNKEYMTS